MKKVILFIMIAFISFTGLNAQKNLYGGIKSGMTEDELFDHVKKESTLEWYYGSLATTIENRKYVISYFFNDNGVIRNIILSSLDHYEWIDYDPNVLENTIELYNLLKVKYGEPIYDKWVDWTDIPDGKRRFVTEFKKETIYVGIYITNTEDDKYYPAVFILDENYEDEPEPESSGGF